MPKYSTDCLIGSPDVQSSTAEAEVLTDKPIKSLTIKVLSNCHISTNYADYVYLEAYERVNFEGTIVLSLRIKESDIPFHWKGLCRKETEGAVV